MKYKHCPWCATRPQYRHKVLHEIHCANEFCKIQPTSGLWEEKAQAVEAWETRKPAPVATQLIAKMKRQLKPKKKL